MYLYLTDNQPFVITGATGSSTRVGIGNTNPGYMLDVSGDINFTGTLRQNGSVFGGGISFPYNAGSISGTAIIGKIRVGSWNYGSYDYMSIQHHSLGWASVTGNYALRQDATGVTDINCATGKSIGFLCNNEYKMFMNSSGQFSINNSSSIMVDAKLSIKSVKDVKEAVTHVLKYGTMHTDCIISNNKKNTSFFLNNVNSSIAMHNVSTQFADGGEFGFGGEIGISTNKLPPRGPVGLNQLTSYKYIVKGNSITRP